MMFHLFALENEVGSKKQQNIKHSFSVWVVLLLGFKSHESDAVWSLNLNEVQKKVLPAIQLSLYFL